MIKRTPTILQSSLVFAALGMCLAAPALAAPSDAWITTKTKLALLTTQGVSGTAVSVDTVNGQVTLYGKVASGEEKNQASTVAQKIDGVQGVRNLLQVVAPEHQAAVTRSDEQIKRQVEQTLRADASLSEITVQSVNNGVVLLAGTTKTLTDHLSAVEIAASVPGVRRVASEIQSPDTLADAQIWREGETHVAKTAHRTGDAARDVWITSAVKLHLLGDRRTPALDINVDTRDGVVTLFGMVPSHEAKAAAEADAHKVSGVSRVANELQIVPKAKQESVKANDDQLRQNVKDAFANHEDLKGIDVEVKNCVARLTGKVPSGMQRLEAAVVARSTQGVCSVQDDLHVSD